jgi:transcriptional regulator with XRE-family HTH domain
MLLIVCRLIVTQLVKCPVMRQNRTDALRQFGQALAVFRQEVGLTQEQLAHRAELHRTYIGSLERGERNPTVTTLLKLADALACPPSELLRRSFA